METYQLINNHNGFLKAFKAKWITDKIDTEGIDFAESLGFYLVDKRNIETYLRDTPGDNALTNSQIRNVFGEVKRIELKLKGKQSEENWEREKVNFALLRPKLAYAQARVTASYKARNSRIKTFKEVLEKAHQFVGNSSHFKNFSAFLEAILAYHKAYGGKEN